MTDYRIIIPGENGFCENASPKAIDGITQLDRDTAAYFNKIFTKNQKIELAYNSDTFACLLLPAGVAYGPDIGLKIQAGPHFFRIGLEHLDFIEMLSGENVVHLPLEIKRALFEAFFEPVLNWFETLSGAKCAIREIQFKPAHIEDYGYALFFRAIRNRDRLIVNGSLSFDRIGLKWLSGLFDQVSSPPPAFNVDLLPLSAAVYLGRTRVRISELEHLEKFDVILIENCIYKTDEKKIRLRFSDTYCLEGVVYDQILTIQKVREDSMSTETAKPEDNLTHEASAEGFDEIEIDLLFELGTVTLPVGELKKIRPGYALDLSQPMEKPVAVKANGKVIGRGELVQIEKNVGVRLLEIDL